MSVKAHGFEFGEFFLDPGEKVLLRNGLPTSITPKIFDLLLVLVQNHGHLVAKQALFDSVWKDSFIEDSNLTFSIRQLRKILDDDAQNPRFVETVPRRGYRFIAGVAEINGQANGSNNIAELINAPVDGGRHHPRPVFYTVGAAVVLGLVLLTVGFFVFRERTRPLIGRPGVKPFELKFQPIASSDKYIAAAISPDGKNLAYSETVNGVQSLWIRQLSSGLNTRILDGEPETTIMLVEFSDDGEYVYLTRGQRGKPFHLDRVSIFGGLAKPNIIDDVDGEFSVSADGNSITFERTVDGKNALVVATGGETRSIFETDRTLTGISFSPDASSIAFAAGEVGPGNTDFAVYTIPAGGGEISVVSDTRWNFVRDVLWLADGSGLLLSAQLKNNAPRQVWTVQLPGGEAATLANSQNNINHISITRDLSRILLTQNRRSSNLVLAPMSDPNGIRIIAPAYLGLSWAGNDAIVYSATASNDDLWKIDVNSMKQVQLTTEDSMDFDPKVSPDGKYIVFQSDRSGKQHLWRANADGSSPVQLSSGDGEGDAAITADSRFVVYHSSKDDSIFRIPIEGGDPTAFLPAHSGNISISPDGSKVAYFEGEGKEKTAVVRAFESGSSVRKYPLPEGIHAGHEIVWSRDGRSICYVGVDARPVSNLWRQSIDGGPPQQFTNFDSEGIFYFDFSADGSQIAMIRGSWMHDAVLATIEPN